MFGVIQVIGGLLLIIPQTGKVGSGVMAVPYVIAILALIASGTTAWGIISSLLILPGLVPFPP